MNGGVKMPRPIHFEIHADDPMRAVEFYKSIFGWKIEKWEGPEDYWLVTTGEVTQPGINGGIMKRRHPDGRVYNSIEVSSVDEYVSKVVANGGQVVVPKMPIPGVGYLAYCVDTEGIVFGITQFDRNAK
jgi:predicted enzyme related to lactoylglutathione lyase